MTEQRLLEATTPTEDDKRPYAPTANVLAVIERVRRLNLPAAVDNDFLRLADVPEGSLGRVAFALRFLGLTDPTTRPTDQLRAIARATDEEYRELLAGVVQSAYAVDFARVDPAQETQTKIINAFQRYEPRSQTTRMVTLFLGLAKAAGIPVLEAPRDRPQAVRVPTRSAPRPTVIRYPNAPKSIRATIPATPVVSTPVDDRSASESGLLFGVTVEDVGALSDEQFPKVWEALGVIARARANSRKAAQDAADQAARRRALEAEEEPEGQ